MTTTASSQTKTGDIQSFTRMDESTGEQWQAILTETMGSQSRVAERILDLLRSLADLTDGFAVDQLTHCCQTAARAEADGADDELVVACLCHDIGKAISVLNHAGIAAEMLRPYVRSDVANMIAAHQDFQGRHYYAHLNMDPDARNRYEGASWYALAEQFADDWDQISFDPAYPTPPLEHFEERVRAVFGQPRSF